MLSLSPPLPPNVSCSQSLATGRLLSYKPRSPFSNFVKQPTSLPSSPYKPAIEEVYIATIIILLF